MARILGLLFLFAAIIVAAADVLEAQGLALRQTGDYWFMIHPDSLQLLQPAVERHVSPWLWDPVITSVLLAPFAAVLLVIAALFLLISRLRKKRHAA